MAENSKPSVMELQPSDSHDEIGHNRARSPGPGEKFQNDMAGSVDRNDLPVQTRARTSSETGDYKDPSVVPNPSDQIDLEKLGSQDISGTFVLSQDGADANEDGKDPSLVRNPSDKIDLQKLRSQDIGETVVLLQDGADGKEDGKDPSAVPKLYGLIDLKNLGSQVISEKVGLSQDGADDNKDGNKVKNDAPADITAMLVNEDKPAGEYLLKVYLEMDSGTEIKQTTEGQQTESEKQSLIVKDANLAVGNEMHYGEVKEASNKGNARHDADVDDLDGDGNEKHSVEVEEASNEENAPQDADADDLADIWIEMGLALEGYLRRSSD